jgi:hypothetical protein
MENSHKPWSRDHKSWSKRMSTMLEMRSIVHQAAQPRAAGDSVKAAIGRAARRCGMGYERTRAIWYGRARAILAEEADALRRFRAEQDRQHLATLRAEIALVEARLRGRDGTA